MQKLKNRLTYVVVCYLMVPFKILKDQKLYQLGWKFGGFKDLGTARGYCDVDNKLIILGYNLLNDKSIDNQQFKEIILHEIAHAVDTELRGTSKHDNVYKTVCKSIGKQLNVSGYMIYSDNQSLGNILNLSKENYSKQLEDNMIYEQFKNILTRGAF